VPIGFVLQELFHGLRLRAGLDAGEGVGDGGSGTPRHGEDHMQGESARLLRNGLAVARWIGEDEVSPERGGVGPDRPFLRHVLDDVVDARRDHAAAGLDDVLHQLMRIAAERIELEAGLLDQGPELGMGRDAHAVPLRKPASDRDERLDIAAGPDEHDDDRQGWHVGRIIRGGGRHPDLADLGGQPRREMGKALGGVICRRPPAPVETALSPAAAAAGGVAVAAERQPLPRPRSPVARLAPRRSPDPSDASRGADVAEECEAVRRSRREEPQRTC
jgi:hypothetical protein